MILSPLFKNKLVFCPVTVRLPSVILKVPIVFAGINTEALIKYVTPAFTETSESNSLIRSCKVGTDLEIESSRVNEVKE